MESGPELKMAATKFRDLLIENGLHGAVKNRPTFLPSGKIWPHGEFSLGYAKVAPDSPLDDRHPADNPEGWKEKGRPEDGGAGVPPALNLSDAPNSHKRPKRGLKGITGYGRQMVKAAGCVMQESLPQYRFSLFTVTLPEMASDIRQQLVSRWSELVRQFLQWGCRQLESAGVPRLIVSVTEVQPKRLQETGQGCLHLHVLVPSVPARKGLWSIQPNSMRDWFKACVTRLTGASDLGWVNVNCKPCKGSVVRYLAKYMSKGGSTLAEAMEDWGEGVCPSTWWNMTGLLRKAVKSSVRSGREVGALLECLVNYAFDTNNVEEIFDYLRHVELDFDGVLVTVGWRGRLTSQAFDGSF